MPQRSFTMEHLYNYVLEHEGRPDVIYAHFSFFAGYAAIKIAERMNVPVMVLEHYSGLMKKVITNAEISTLKYVIANADEFACVSDGLKRFVVHHTGISEGINVIYNMVDSKFTYYEPKNEANVRFFSLGNLNHRKRFHLLLEAFFEAFEPSDNVRLFIAGKGEMETTLNSMIRATDRREQVVMLGSLSRNQILEQYQLCNCFALPSAFETFGLVWREAMAVGRPIITTDHGGFDNWDDRWGLKIPVDDKLALVDALRNMRGNWNKYDGKLISDMCLDTHSSKKISRQIEQTLYTAINKRRCI
ncbi:MAG: glycosyltransferase [Anaerolineaceae bacterium]|jgi:glycosyltransferase involved in cell wall biosynthesis